MERNTDQLPGQMPPPGSPGDNLTGGGTEYEERDQLADGDCVSRVALAEGRCELRAVAAHEGDEEALEMQETDGIDNAGKRRKNPCEHQAARHAGFGHGCLSRTGGLLVCCRLPSRGK